MLKQTMIKNRHGLGILILYIILSLIIYSTIINSFFWLMILPGFIKLKPEEYLGSGQLRPMFF